MTTYHPTNASIHILSRALIIQGDSILVCKHKGHYFLPGGHVENGESLVGALEREFIEELGIFPHTAPVYIGMCEHQFAINDTETQHEINHVFVVTVAADVVFESQEPFLTSEKVSIADLETVPLLPAQLKAALRTWFTDKKEFFVGM